MRVSIVNTSLVGPDATGQSMLNQAEYFQSRGDTVRIYVTVPPQRVPDEMLPFVSVSDLTTLITDRDAHFSASDLYVFHYAGRYPLMESMKNLGQGMVIFYFHNVTPPNLWGNDFHREALALDLAYVDEILPFADIAVADSTFNARQLSDDHHFDPDRTHVLPLAVKLDQFQPKPKPTTLLDQYQLQDKPVILYVGRMAGNKRIDLLVEALPLIRQQVPQAALLLVGDDQGNPALQETAAKGKVQAEALGVEQAVIFTGIVDDLPAYYQVADVYASASLHEGFGVPLLEAMASGVPIVVSRATAHPWVLGEAGVLVEPENVADLAEKIIQVLTDDGLAQDLVERGLKRVKAFSLANYQTGWGNIIEMVTASLADRVTQREVDTSDSLTALTLNERRLLGKLDIAILKADVMDRHYALHSNIPLIGSWVTWLRHNLTSHLWQPYLDPALERQVNFNQSLIQAIRQMIVSLATRLAQAENEINKLADNQTKLEVRLDELETLVDQLTIE